MPVKAAKRAKTSDAEPVTILAPASAEGSTSTAFDALVEDTDMDYSAEAIGYALQLIEAAAEDDFEKVKVLVGEIKADAWVQDAQGWTALHAAACECSLGGTLLAATQS